MTSENPTLTGPDLGRGITLTDLDPNGMLLGHASGEAVLLLRNGDEVFAISAHCSHYGGPLAEGVLDGDTIHCPWHHACFSVRTGEALRAPALSPVACWQVEQHDGKVMVTNKLERDPLAPTMCVPGNADHVTRLERVVIIGAGAAGSAAADACPGLGRARGGARVATTRACARAAAWGRRARSAREARCVVPPRAHAGPNRRRRRGAR